MRPMITLNLVKYVPKNIASAGIRYVLRGHHVFMVSVCVARISNQVATIVVSMRIGEAVRAMTCVRRNPGDGTVIFWQVVTVVGSISIKMNVVLCHAMAV